MPFRRCAEQRFVGWRNVMISGRFHVGHAIPAMAVHVHFDEPFFNIERFLLVELSMPARLVTPIRPIVPAVERAVVIDLVTRDDREPWIDQVHGLLHPIQLLGSADRVIILSGWIVVLLVY